jgi:large subunit ribosomal protein L19
MNLLQQIEQETLQNATKGKTIPNFAAGDTVRVNVRIVEGNNERVQAFEGICIGRKNRGLNSSFTIRKISHGEGVERIFPLYSPRLDSIELVRRGDVRRAKLYYLRGLTGKAARITEKRDYVDASADATPAAEGKSAKAPKAKAEKAEKKAKKAS